MWPAQHYWRRTGVSLGDIEVATTPWNWREAVGAEGLCRQAERAEALGFHSFWLPENHFGGAGALPAPLLLLAAVAARTSTLRLGCTSYLLPIRHPLLAAEEVAVLDQLCGGRLILGVGRGVQPALFSAFGLASAEKRERFAENLAIMRRAWRGEPIGEDAAGEPLYLAPTPLQRPEPPVWVAAFGPLALEQVAGLGLPYLASPLESIEQLSQNYRRHRALVAEANLPAVDTVPVMRTVFITPDARLASSVREALRRQMVSRMRESNAAVDDWALVGDAVRVREKLAQYRERLGLSHLILRGGMPLVDESEQLRSLELTLAAVSGL